MREEKIRLLFVCLGNICRSPSAEAVMKKLVKDAGLGDRIEIDSAGITAFVNNFNMMVKDVHHKGDAYAAGLTYGYVWVLGDHWNIEATAGVGVLRYRQFKYDKGTPKPGAVNDSKTTIAPVKLGVSFVYIIR